MSHHLLRTPAGYLPLLYRVSATLILPAVVVVPVTLTCGSEWMDCLAFLFSLTGVGSWVVYSLWLVGVVFQYGLWRYKRGPGRGRELGELGWSIGFYFMMALVVFFSVALLSMGE